MLQFPTVTLTTRITEGCVGPAAAPDSDTHACRMWRLIGAVSKVSNNHTMLQPCSHIAI